MVSQHQIDTVISIMETLFTEQSVAKKLIAKLHTDAVRPYIERLCQLEAMHHANRGNQIIIGEYGRIAQGVARHIDSDEDLPPLEDKYIGKIVKAI